MEVVTMIKGLVFDKDGSMYSIEPFIKPFAEHLSRHFSKDKFMELYEMFRKQVIIGHKYNPATLEEDGNGMNVRNALLVPVVVALHLGLERKPLQEFEEFSDSYISNNLDLDEALVLKRILEKTRCKKAVVSNDKNSEKVLRTLGVYNLFDMFCFGANKSKNLKDICRDIEEKFGAKPNEIVWVEDDVSFVETLTDLGYRTVLRKTRGFNYDPNINSAAKLVLEDDLHKLEEMLATDK